MLGDKAAALAPLAEEYLKVGEENHNKWNSTTWTHVRHLLGLLCLEERRIPFARALLRIMGHAPDCSYAATSDAVDKEALVDLRAWAKVGELSRELKVFDLLRPAVIGELLILASEPPTDTRINPIFRYIITD